MPHLTRRFRVLSSETDSATSARAQAALDLHAALDLWGAVWVDVDALHRGQLAQESPEEYRLFVTEDLRRWDDALTLDYGEHVFRGIVRCLLDPHGVEDALQPGTEIFVRYHNEETGAPGQVAHIIIRHPLAEGWAEVYSDGV